MFEKSTEESESKYSKEEIHRKGIPFSRIFSEYVVVFDDCKKHIDNSGPSKHLETELKAVEKELKDFIEEGESKKIVVRKEV